MRSICHRLMPAPSFFKGPSSVEAHLLPHRPAFSPTRLLLSLHGVFPWPQRRRTVRSIDERSTPRYSDEGNPHAPEAPPPSSSFNVVVQVATHKHPFFYTNGVSLALTPIAQTLVHTYREAAAYSLLLRRRV